MSTSTSTAAESGAAEPATADDGALSHRQIMTILSGLLLGMFLAALDQTIVTTAIRTIGDDLNGLSVQAWVTTAFLITSTIATPLFGKLSDLYGRKPLFMLAITIFIAGSALCGLAQSMYMLAAFRAFQGIGAGGIMPLALAIIGDIIPPRERAKYQGYFMAVFATSSVLGPVVGGFLAGQSHLLGVPGWRWIFYINVPIGIFALFVITRVLHLDHTRKDHRIDWTGAAALAVGLVPLLIIAEQGRTWGWTSVGAFLCYVIGVVGLVSFVRIEARMGNDALLPLRLFKNNVFALGSAQATVIGMGMFGGLAAIPLYLQIVKGASPTKAGLLLLPLILSMMVASLSAGVITMRTGRYKIFPVLGSVLMVIGLLTMTRIGADTPLWQTDIYMGLFGLGLGMNMQAIVLAMQNAVEPKDMGVATASVTFFRQVGGTLGTAVFLSILFTKAGTGIPSQLAKANPTPTPGQPLTPFQAAAALHPKQAASLKSISINDTSALQRIDHALAHPFLTGFSNAMDLVFLVGAILLVAAVVLSAAMKEVPLRMVSGLQAAREAEVAAALAAESVPTSSSAPSVEADASAAPAQDSGERDPEASAEGSGPHVGKR